MLNPMTIPVAAPGIGDVMRQMRGLVAQVNSVAQAQQQLTSSTRSLSQAQQQMRLPGPQGDLQRVLRRSPIARLQQLQSLVPFAQTDDQRQGLDILIAQAQRRLLLLQRRGAGTGGALGRIGEAILSARVGIGGGGVQFMPLVSRVMDVLESLPGPIGLVAKAMTALVTATTEAVKNIHELASASAASGGSIREVATLRGLGLPAGQIAGISGGLRDRLLSDPNAVAAANRLGLPPTMPIVAGGQDNAKILLRAVDALRKVMDGEERLRLARMLGLEALTDLLRASDYVYQGIKRDAAATAQVVDASSQQAQADLSAGWGRFVDSIKLVATAIGEPLMKIAGPVLNLAADAINSVALAFKVLADLSDALLPNLGELAKWIEWLLGKLGLGGDDQSRALKDNTDALHANTRALQPGTYGGGERLRGALPGSLGGELLRRGMEGNAIRFGAFALG